MYTAIVLDEDSQNYLKSSLGETYHELSKRGEWEILCHHVTICMGRMKNKYRFNLGEEVELDIVGMGKTWGHHIPIDKRKDIPLDAEIALAVMVRLPEGKTIKNDVPHVTLVVNRAVGGKPYHSNFANWTEFVEGLPPHGFVLRGVVQECK